MSDPSTDEIDHPDPERRDLNPIVPVGWFSENTNLRSVSPYVATESDVWVVSEAEEDVIGMALVEDGKVHRLGVSPERRREGIASSIIDHLQAEYGTLELDCRQSLEANKFYAATGWELVGTRTADPEDLNEWRLADGE